MIMMMVMLVAVAVIGCYGGCSFIFQAVVWGVVDKNVEKGWLSSPIPNFLRVSGTVHTVRLGTGKKTFFDRESAFFCYHTWISHTDRYYRPGSADGIN